MIPHRKFRTGDAKANGALVRGHCLCWYQQLPIWLTANVAQFAQPFEYQEMLKAAHAAPQRVKTHQPTP